MKFETEIISSKIYVINLIGKALFFIGILPIVFVIDFRLQGGIFKILNVPDLYYYLVWLWIIFLLLTSFYLQSKKYLKGKIIFNSDSIYIYKASNNNIDQKIKYADIQILKIIFNNKTKNKYSRNIIEGGKNWVEIKNRSEYRFEIYLKSEKQEQEFLKMLQNLDSLKIIKKIVIQK